ncbi:MAG: hypothetical protein K0R63_618 [Rickettsiales bacterium]|jgi:type IV pilus assembly protein PilB|nr:hypothetical protein [Rickettsiales bacterium]
MITLPREVDAQFASFLKDHKIISKEAYDAALELGKAGGGLIDALICGATVTEKDIADKLAAEYGLKRIEYKIEFFHNRPLPKEISNNFIKTQRIIPFRDNGKVLSVIVADPAALASLDKIKALSGGREIEAAVTTIGALLGLTNTLLDGEKEVALRGTGRTSGAAAAVQASTSGTNGGMINAPAGAPLSPKEAFMKALQESEQQNLKAAGTAVEAKSSSNVIEFVDNVLENAVTLKVSDIHFEVYDGVARVRYRRDGVLQEVKDFEKFLQEHYSAVITRIKILSSLDISERRLPQDGRITFYLPDEKSVDIRVSILPTVFGERVVMRVIDQGALSLSLEKLGFAAGNLTMLEKCIHAPQGMILVTGPTGSGKSTTLYAILNTVNEEGVNILTAEDPVEYNLTGVGQVYVKEKIGLTFASALRSFLRQDPEIIMVGEIRDKETGDISIKAALTGHLVLSTLHTNDAPSTITRLINMGIPNYLITASLSIIIAQRLARVICQDCKQVDESIAKDKLMAIGFSEAEAAIVKACKGSGCEKCFNSGVKGRRAIHEVLMMTDKLREAVLGGVSDIKLKEMAKTEGYVSMQEVGRQLVRDGFMTVQEYQRILVLD